MRMLRSPSLLPTTPIEVQSPFLTPRVVDASAFDEMGQRLLALTRAADRAEKRLAATAHAAATLTSQLDHILRTQAEHLSKVQRESACAPKVDGSNDACTALAELLSRAADERHHAEQIMIDLAKHRTRTDTAANRASAAAIRAVEASARANRAASRLHERTESRNLDSLTVVVTSEARAWAEMIPAGAD